MSVQRRPESPQTSGSVPAPVDDAIDTIVDAVSSGARISPGATRDPSSDGMPAMTLPSTTTRRWMGSRIVRRIAPILIAFGVGLIAAVWSLRTFEFIDRSADSSRAGVERDVVSAPPRVDPLPSRALQPFTAFASRLERRALGLTADARDAPQAQALEGTASAVPAVPSEIVRRETKSEPTPSAEAPALVATTPESIVPTSPVPIEAMLDTPASPVEREAVTVDIDAIDTEAVRATVEDYAQALEQLDVNAAAALWPTVDRRALGRAFSSLKSQTVAFDECDVALASPTATARCEGTTEYIVKIGGSAPRTGRFEWLFRMRKHDDAWKIEGVTASEADPIRHQQ